jgi:hypothetical protein
MERHSAAVGASSAALGCDRWEEPQTLKNTYSLLAAGGSGRTEMVERHIYGYRWKEIGVYVYVGSAFDMAERDREHRKLLQLPVDRFMEKHGKDTFELVILETVHGETDPWSGTGYSGEETMSYSEFILTVIAVLLFCQLFRPSGAKERHEKLLSQLKSLEETLKDAIEESTQQITGRKYYTDFLSLEKGYQWPRWREHLDDDSEDSKSWGAFAFMGRNI